MKILIVDDNEKNLKLFQLLVKSLGHESVLAHDGMNGVKAAKTEMPALILMDIQMPGIDGVSALRQLKADEATRNIPLIAITSYAMKGDREKFIGEGFTDYISKPINKNEFMATVRKHLERQ